MARKPTPAEPQRAELSQQQIVRGIDRLEKQLERVRAFDPESLDRGDPDSTTRPLEESIRTAITETFGTDTVEYNRFFHAARIDWPLSYLEETPHFEKVKGAAESRTRSIQLLTAAVELLRDRLEDHGQSVAPAGGARPPVAASKRIFIVHGQDEGPKEAVARLIGQLGYEPIILHEQPNRGRTIIQKFQDEAADVGFAIVLMTPDDETSLGAKRARQNVVLELGFFLGRLGPDRVAAIIKNPIEKPSDFDGVVYIPYDGNWRQDLAKELKAAGYHVDWNVVMG
jgi:predicted nucleotide-binding protein